MHTLNTLGVAMIDAKDSQTGDLLPVPKKRGRPATGRALSAVERKRLQRKRHKDVCPPDEDLTQVPLEALYRKASKFIKWGDDGLLQEVCSELLRRARAVESSKYGDVTVPKTPGELWPVPVTKKSNLRYALGEDTWTGKGKRPQWVLDALDRGLSLYDLLIK